MCAKKVVVIGSLNFDIIAKQNRMPQKGETMSGDDLVYAAGGKGGNQAAACALLGLDTTMIGCVGQDIFGDILIKTLTNCGVDTHLLKKRNTSGTGIVHTMPDGDYYSTVIHGANYAITKEDIDEHMDVIKNADYLIFQQEIPDEILPYVLDKLNDSNVTVLLNNAPARFVNDETLAKIDYLIVNETEAGFMVNHPVDNFEVAKESCQELLKKVKRGVVITLGAIGSVAVTNEETFECHSQAVKAVDATGAGDSYIGAFVYGLSQNMTLQKCMKFASKVSAITVTKTGGQTSFPTLKEVTEKYPDEDNALGA